MTSELPDDISKWPASPWLILGLDRSASKSDVRKAYAKLVRRFRPDSHAAEFQRINQAYELLRTLSSNPGGSVPQRGVPTRPADSRSPESAEKQKKVASASGEAEQEVSESADESFDTFDAISAFREGSVQEAWASLSQRYERSPSTEVAIARYWLLVLAPEVDEERTPLKVLKHAMRTSGFDPTLARLLQRELIQSPKEMPSKEVEEVLKLVPVRMRSGLLLDRWKKLAEVHAWDTIKSDLEQQRSDFVNGHPLLWINMMVSIVGVAAWDVTEPSRSLVKTVRSEIDEYPELQIQAATELERLDRLDGLLASRSKIANALVPDVHATIRASIPRLWLRGTTRIDELIRLSLEFENKSSFRLTRIDSATKRSPPEVNFILEVYEEELPVSPFPPPDVAERIEQFYVLTGDRKYSSFRHKAADFCVAEFVFPRWIASVIEEKYPSATISDNGQETYLSEAIRADLSLSVLAHANLCLQS